MIKLIIPWPQLKWLFVGTLCLVFVDITIAQTTFTELAASKGLNLDGNKDGGFTFADFNNDGYLDVMVNTSTNDDAHRSRLYFSSGPPNYT
ncbi:MAG: hypothetical protein AAGD05_06120, partial [Bacteroidota bacterium]